MDVLSSKKNNGFIKATKSLVIENLNNIGINFGLKILFKLNVIIMFLKKLKKLKKLTKLKFE